MSTYSKILISNGSKAVVAFNSKQELIDDIVRENSIHHNELGKDAFSLGVKRHKWFYKFPDGKIIIYEIKSNSSYDTFTETNNSLIRRCFVKVSYENNRIISEKKFDSFSLMELEMNNSIEVFESNNSHIISKEQKGDFCWIITYNNTKKDVYNVLKDNSFDRRISPQKHSWAYNVFNRYATYLERIDMAFKSVSHIAECSEAFDCSHDNEKACNYFETHNDSHILVKDVKNCYGEFKKWKNLNKLLAVNCYFEIYLHNVLILATESCPQLLDSSYPFDGFSNLKNNNPIVLSDIDKKFISSCLNSNWNLRFTNLINLLKIVPNSQLYSDLNGCVSDLSSVKELRNSVGHFFGREESLTKSWNTIQIPQLKQLRLDDYLSYLKTIHFFAETIDRFVMDKYVGCYQELYFLHKIINGVNNQIGLPSKISFLKARFLNGKRGSYNNSFLSGLIKWYDEN